MSDILYSQFSFLEVWQRTSVADSCIFREWLRNPLSTIQKIGTVRHFRATQSLTVQIRYQQFHTIRQKNIVHHSHGVRSLPHPEIHEW